MTRTPQPKGDSAAEYVRYCGVRACATHSRACVERRDESPRRGRAEGGIQQFGDLVPVGRPVEVEGEPAVRPQVRGLEEPGVLAQRGRIGRVGRKRSAPSWRSVVAPRGEPPKYANTFVVKNVGRPCVIFSAASGRASAISRTRASRGSASSNMRGWAMGSSCRVVRSRSRGPGSRPCGARQRRCRTRR